MNGKLCPLELLHGDALFEVLSAVGSISDLSAFIRATPVVYGCFTANKRAILLNVVSQSLGPVIREALALSRIEKLDFHDVNYFKLAADSIHLYGRLLLDPCPLTKGLDNGMVTKLARITGTTEFFVDICASPNLRLIETVCGEGVWPLTENEHRRFAQALLRYQILINLFPT